MVGVDTLEQPSYRGMIKRIVHIDTLHMIKSKRKSVPESPGSTKRIRSTHS